VAEATCSRFPGRWRENNVSEGSCARRPTCRLSACHPCKARKENSLAKIDFVYLTSLEDEGDEHALGAAVVEILRRGDMTAETQRWLARCFDHDRGRRDRGSDEMAQTKFRLEFKRRNGMKKSNDASLEDKTRHDVFDEACAKFGGPERAIEELVVRESYGGFTWCETTAKNCFEAIKASRDYT
jgi:hypothetical protein